MHANQQFLRKAVSLLNQIGWPADPSFELERSVQLLQQVAGLPPPLERIRFRAISLLEETAVNGLSSLGMSSVQEARFLIEHIDACADPLQSSAGASTKPL